MNDFHSVEGSPIPLHCTYRNKKTGDLYFACGLCENQTNAQVGEAMIVYYLEANPCAKYVRKAEEFIEKFEREV